MLKRSRKDSVYRLNDSLKKAIEFGYGIRILQQDQFEMIVSFIISANNQIPRIKTLLDSYLKLMENSYKNTRVRNTMPSDPSSSS